MDIHGLTPLLQVFDLARSVRFYRDVLGFTAVSWSHTNEHDSYWVMLERGNSVFMLNAAYEDDERPASPDPARVRAHSDTTLYFGCNDVEEAYAHLRAKGWQAQEPLTTPYGMRQVYARDPDGFELCFQHAATRPSTAHSGA